MASLYPTVSPPDSTLESYTRDAVAELPEFDTVAKRDFLEYRLAGCGEREAAKLCGINPGQLKMWQATDPEFGRWTVEYSIAKMRREFQIDLTRNTFARMMFLFMRADLPFVTKAITEPHQMSEDDWTQYRAIRKHYGPSELVALARATQEQTAPTGPSFHANEIHVHIDGSEVDSQAAKQAAAAKLMRAFVTSGEYVDAESRVIDSDDSNTD